MRPEHVRLDQAEARLARALLAAAGHAGVAVAIAGHRSRSWASATFVGAQHRLILIGRRCPPLDAWLAALPEVEWALRGHLVASLEIDGVDLRGDDVHVTLAVLTLEDC